MCEICYAAPCLPGCPNAPEPPVAYVCFCCGEAIYAGEEYYDINGVPWCQGCIHDARKEAEAEEAWL